MKNKTAFCSYLYRCYFILLERMMFVNIDLNDHIVRCFYFFMAPAVTRFIWSGCGILLQRKYMKISLKSQNCDDKKEKYQHPIKVNALKMKSLNVSCQQQNFLRFALLLIVREKTDPFQVN